MWGSHSGLAAKVAVPVAVIDQAHKWWMIAVYGIEQKQRVSVLPFFDLVYTLNTGISYSLLDGKSYGWQLALAAFAFVASLAMWVWIVRGNGTRLMAVSLALIIGGAVGNAIDRVMLGGVADFFLLHAYGYSWYVFNIADVAIVAGVLGLLYDAVVSSPSRNDAANPS
ncbi:MAG: signal peptidase II [Hyphomicrobiaceae bacterium]|nr:signal peptidase II [Hyphomicrobiaceae bacterium]